MDRRGRVPFAQTWKVRTETLVPRQCQRQKTLQDREETGASGVTRIIVFLLDRVHFKY